MPNMTIKECIDIVDNNKPNQYTIKDKVRWISLIEKTIIDEVLKTHEGYDGRYDDFTGYSEDKLSVTLVVPFPHDQLYVEYLKMMIDKENGETARYNNSAASCNKYMSDYRKEYNKTHMPLNVVGLRNMKPPKKATLGLSDAEYENLKKDLTYILTEFFSDVVSADKLYDIVMKYVQNNTELLKGKDGENGKDGRDGHTPEKGIDYYTRAEKQELVAQVSEKLSEQLISPKYVYEFSNGMQLAALGDGVTIQKINSEGETVWASELVYADFTDGKRAEIRADRAELANRDRERRDIVETYATKEEVGNIETALDGVIAIQNALIGGDSV